jgi:putative intracellular protease/amidase
MISQKTVGALLFEGFELLDVYGPLEAWGMLAAAGKKEARWVEDGPIFTSSGVSAGIDMTLAVIAKLEGRDTAEAIAVRREYEWHRDASWDPFAKIHGLV